MHSRWLSVFVDRGGVQRAKRFIILREARVSDLSVSFVQKFKGGDHVIVRKSPYSDIRPGTVGSVHDEMPAGYAIEITGLFTNARHERAIETRCVYFKAGQIRRATGHEDRDESLGLESSGQ